MTKDSYVLGILKTKLNETNTSTALCSNYMTLGIYEKKRTLSAASPTYKKTESYKLLSMA